MSWQHQLEQFRGNRPVHPRRRAIGWRGTAARLAAGLLLIGGVIRAQQAGGFDPAPWALGLAGLPAVLLAWQWLRAGHDPERLRATGVVRRPW